MSCSGKVACFLAFSKPPLTDDEVTTVGATEVTASVDVVTTTAPGEVTTDGDATTTDATWHAVTSEEAAAGPGWIGVTEPAESGYVVATDAPLPLWEKPGTGLRVNADINQSQASFTECNTRVLFQVHSSAQYVPDDTAALGDERASSAQECAMHCYKHPECTLAKYKTARYTKEYFSFPALSLALARSTMRVLVFSSRTTVYVYPTCH